MPQAYRLLQHAIAQGDGYAAATLAEWRLSGQIIRRDLEVARTLFLTAAELGVDAAYPVYIAMLANGAGGLPRHWSDAIALLKARAKSDEHASRQMRLLDEMELDETGHPKKLPPATRLIGTTRLERIPGFLSQAECEYLIQRAAPLMQPSVIVHPQTGQAVQDPIRSAKAAAFPFVLEDPAIHAINRRIGAVTQTEYAQGEPIQVLRYDEGDEYKLHSDVLPQGQNQRSITLLVTLNESFEGGETHFPHLGVTWRGRTGEALRFDNTDLASQALPSMWHAGTRVRRGTKFLLSKWIREAPLDLAGPPGRPF